MQLKDKVVVVTGASGGIGRALVRRFLDEGAAHVVALDLKTFVPDWAADDRLVTMDLDVSNSKQMSEVIDRIESTVGPVDLFCSNAGIVGGGGLTVDEAAWDRVLGINVLAHVFAAQALIPRMLERGSGYILATASAAGLLSSIGDAPYSVSKHAAVAFAEWLAITYGDRGLKFSCLCPQGVNTPMLEDIPRDVSAAAIRSERVLEPADVATAVVLGLEAEKFLILPHEEVATYYVRRATDVDRWLGGMRKIQARYSSV